MWMLQSYVIALRCHYFLICYVLILNIRFFFNYKQLSVRKLFKTCLAIFLTSIVKPTKMTVLNVGQYMKKYTFSCVFLGFVNWYPVSRGKLLPLLTRPT